MANYALSDRPALRPTASTTQDLPLANLEMNNVQAAFSALDTQGAREYYECSDPPTQLTGLIESHFKGVAFFQNKVILTHTDLDPISPASNGRYLIGDVIAPGGQGTVDYDGYTEYPGWCHPCGAQACGIFMAMGIQQSASAPGSKVSEIQIYDIRNAQADEPLVLLGAIPRPADGINGVAMTRETGDDGHYLVAGVNGNVLTVYRSTGPSLLPPDGGVEFVQVLQDPAFPASGAGLALITQVDGSIFLVSMNADDDGSNSLAGLYRLDLNAEPPTCNMVEQRPMPIPGMSDSVTLLEEYLAAIMIFNPPLGAALTALLALGSGLMNSSFRWGRGLAITSPDAIAIYATDRNVLPLSQIPVVGSSKDFSVVVWASDNSGPSGISAPLAIQSVDDDQRPYAFLVGTDGQLWQRYWDNDRWNWYAAGTPSPSVSIGAGLGALTTADRPYVFMAGSDGHLWQNYWDNNQWNWYDAGTPNSDPDIQVAGPVGALAVGGDQRPYVFLVGTDGHLWQDYWDNNQWNWYDCGTPPSQTAGVIVSSGVGVLETPDGRPYAFVIGSDGHLWQNYWANNQWNWYDCGTPPSSTSGVTVSEGVGALVTSDGRPYAFVIASDGTLWQNYWDNNQWNWYSSGTPPSPTSGVAVSKGVGVLMTSDGRPYAFVIASDGHLWQNYWDNNQWNWFDSGMPGAGISCPVGVTTAGSDDNPDAFVLGADGHLWLSSWDGNQWNWLDLGL
jgi:hypothetical protein